MRTRRKIEAAINKKKEAIKSLKNEIVELGHEWYLLSDREQQFVEQMETITRRENRKKVTEEKLIGKVTWKEDFIDEDTGKTFSIERCQIVRINGEWIV